MRRGEAATLVERVVDADVGVEIDDLVASFVQQLAQQQRLDGGRQLGDVVDAGEPADLTAPRGRCRPAAAT